ncbi:alpha-amylase family glycosyl hydrolase [Halapricum salinum]|uniref:Alpha-amylase n=1 Tax=Halapricum salinum TaxID=1457250 RepID=A0A4D6HCI3_9EURY|nr:alpha-amylase family glycosyl hydrolase [Halapricum salinum]QCC50762.1 alpha-amylase [Halapricum salinum]
MHHPGPPRFVTVGDDVELAPRRPESDADFAWSIAERPDDSEATVGNSAVEHLVPDEPGVYRLELGAPDGTHELTVRAFEDVTRPFRLEYDAAELPEHDPGDVWVTTTFNDFRVGELEPELIDDTYVYEDDVSPGRYNYAITVGDDFMGGDWGSIVVDGPERPRVRLDARVESSADDEEIVIEADAMPGPHSDADPEDLDVEFYVDDRDREALCASASASEASGDGLTVDGHEARCSLDAVDDQLRVHAVTVGERPGVSDTVRIESDGSVARPNEPPEWLDGATMYEIYVRSFVGDSGVTFERLEERVPYLEWLGIDVLWLTPILESRSAAQGEDAEHGPHGYDIVDYFDVAPDLGTRADFESFVDSCHDAGIHVLFDLVINHTSREHPAFQQSARGVAEYDDWFTWVDADDAFVSEDVREQSTGDVERVYDHYFDWWTLPNLNYDSLAVREHVLDIVDEWADTVDGFRCDVAWGVPHGFWKEVRQRVKTEHSAVDGDFLLLDETVPRDPHYGELEFDLHYDTGHYYGLREIGRGERPADDLLDVAESPAVDGIREDYVPMRYVDNHDEDRYVEECGRDALVAAVTATFALPGVPMVYYGQETGLRETRADMNWVNGDRALSRRVKSLIDLRASTAALVDGSVEAVDCDVSVGDDERVTAFARDDGEQRLVVVLHFGEGTAEVELSGPVGETDLVTGEPVAEGTTISVANAVVLAA